MTPVHAVRARPSAIQVARRPVPFRGKSAIAATRRHAAICSHEMNATFGRPFARAAQMKLVRFAMFGAASAHAVARSSHSVSTPGCPSNAFLMTMPIVPPSIAPSMSGRNAQLTSSRPYVMRSMGGSDAGWKLRANPLTKRTGRRSGASSRIGRKGSGDGRRCRGAAVGAFGVDDARASESEASREHSNAGARCSEYRSHLETNRRAGTSERMTCGTNVASQSTVSIHAKASRRSGERSIKRAKTAPASRRLAAPSSFTPKRAAAAASAQNTLRLSAGRLDRVRAQRTWLVGQPEATEVVPHAAEILIRVHRPVHVDIDGAL